MVQEPELRIITGDPDVDHVAAWQVLRELGAIDYPGQFVNDMADAMYYHTYHWWLGRKGGSE